MKKIKLSVAPSAFFDAVGKKATHPETWEGKDSMSFPPSAKVVRVKSPDGKVGEGIVFFSKNKRPVFCFKIESNGEWIFPARYVFISKKDLLKKGFKILK